MDAATLVATVRQLGVRLEVVNGRLRYSPAARVPLDLRRELVAFRSHVAEVLDDECGPVVHYLTAEEEVVACRLGNLVERLYEEAAEVRRRLGSGWPGAAQRDARVLEARSHIAALLAARTDAASTLRQERGRYDPEDH